MRSDSAARSPREDRGTSTQGEKNVHSPSSADSEDTTHEDTASPAGREEVQAQRHSANTGSQSTPKKKGATPGTKRKAPPPNQPLNPKKPH